MSTADVLRNARALYAANPSHAPGNESPASGTYCPVTALCTIAEIREGSTSLYESADRAFCAAIGTDEIPAWNARNSTADVLAAFDRAIAACEAE